MKTLKILFYIVYISSILLVLVISINLYEALDLFKDWGWFKYFSDLPVLGRNLLYGLSALMTLELIFENLYLKNVRKELKAANQQIKDLEEKLYEKAQEEVTKDGFTELRLDDLSK